eukprot:TRINITY_DN959_c0_g1_i2.p1 TRINITY_DN959_c0_g1~~TRINITY_DN959_c0_g1_i2.p1  ORF type:complete len:342 (-),score=55.44 TRINITY_DN959_c0_g1_i2:15-1040(-)
MGIDTVIFPSCSECLFGSLLLVAFLYFFFFFNDTAPTEIYTILFVGSVRCVQETAIDVAQKGKKAAVDYKGAYFERKTERDKEQQLEPSKFEQKTNEVSVAESDLPHEETDREKYIKICKRNSNRILHERNIYVFLASVAEDAMNNFADQQLSQIVGFLLVKQLLILIDNLKSNLMYKNNVFGLQSWNQYVETKDFQDILQYIIKEFDVFNVYFQQLYEKLVMGIKSGKQQLSEEYQSIVNENFKQDVNKILKSGLTKYIKSLIQNFLKNPKKFNSDQLISGWIHIDRILDCLRIDQVFQFEDKEGNQFNFKIYYELPNNYDYEQLVQLVQSKLLEAKIII